MAEASGSPSVGTGLIDAQRLWHPWHSGVKGSGVGATGVTELRGRTSGVVQEQV